MRNVLRLISAPLLLLAMYPLAVIAANPIEIEAFAAEGSLSFILESDVFVLQPYLWPFQELFRAETVLRMNGFVQPFLIHGTALLLVLTLSVAGALYATLWHVVWRLVLYGKMIKGAWGWYLKRTFVLQFSLVAALYGMAYVIIGVLFGAHREWWSVSASAAEHFFMYSSVSLFFLVWIGQHLLNNSACGIKIIKESASTTRFEASEDVSDTSSQPIEHTQDTQ